MSCRRTKECQHTRTAKKAGQCSRLRRGTYKDRWWNEEEKKGDIGWKQKKENRRHTNAVMTFSSLFPQLPAPRVNTMNNIKFAYLWLIEKLVSLAVFLSIHGITSVVRLFGCHVRADGGAKLTALGLCIDILDRLLELRSRLVGYIVSRSPSAMAQLRCDVDSRLCAVPTAAILTSI